MKFYLAIALVAAVFLQTEAKRCRDEDDCEAGECCISRGFLRRGDCRKLAQLDEPCSQKDEVASFFDVVYLGNCPCDDGLSCEPSEYRNLPFIGTVGINEKCTAGVTVAPEPETEEPETEEPETEAPETEAPEPEPEPEAE